LVSLVYLVYLVCLVYLVGLVYLVQQNKRDRPDLKFEVLGSKLRKPRTWNP